MSGLTIYSRAFLAIVALLLCLMAHGQGTDTTNRVIILTSDSLNQVSHEKFKVGAYDEAMALAGDAYNLSSRIDYHEGMGDALMTMGNVERSRLKAGIALRNYFTALREYEWTGNVKKQYAASVVIGDVFRSAGMNEKALEYYYKAIETGRPFMSKEEILPLRDALAGTYLDLGQYEDALKNYLELYDVYKEQKNVGLETSVLGQITSCFNALEKYEEATRYNLKALEASRDKGDKEGEMAALNNLGYSYKRMGEPEMAMEYLSLAVALGAEIGAPSDRITVTLTNMAIIAQNMGDARQSLEYFIRAEDIARKAGDKNEMARIHHLISLTYYNLGDYHNAREYNREAIASSSQARDAEQLGMAYLAASNISAALYDYELSMEQYRRYLSIRDSLVTVGRLHEQMLAEQQYLVERTEKELDEMIYTRQVERLELGQLRLETEKKEQEVELLKKTTALQEAALLNQELEKDRALQELLLAEEKLAAERKDREIKDLKVQQQLQESELRRSELEKEKQQQEIQVLTQEKEITELSLQKVRTRNRFLAGVILLALITLVIIIRSWRYARKTNRTLANQRNKIQQQKEAIESQYDIIKIEREKSEKLLLNILPEETAAELKENGFASPRHYERVTVLFTDFVGFTMVSEKMTPQEIVRELDYCFLEFDKIIDRYNLEKIKTIGDSYMCAGGIPLPNDSNPFDVVMAALEIRDFMAKERKAREARGQQYWQLRIGVNTGPVVAGVVGKNKFAYDIWGDAVNTASRMESSGEAGKVNISGATYEIIRDQFKCTYRGKVKAKNKGEVDMYFVEGPVEVSG